MKLVLFDLGDTLEHDDVPLPGARDTLQALLALRDETGQPAVRLDLSDLLRPNSPEGGALGRKLKAADGIRSRAERSRRRTRRPRSRRPSASLRSSRAIPALTGGIAVPSAVHGEQRRPGQRGRLARQTCSAARCRDDGLIGELSGWTTTRTDPRARAFVEALRAFEENADPAALARTFADGATVVRLDARGERTDFEQFWREYRGQFSEVSTTFTHAVVGDVAVSLEWTSAARLTDGRPADYRGVTVIELDDDKITNLRTYYDSAAFVPVPASVVASQEGPMTSS